MVVISSDIPQEIQTVLTSLAIIRDIKEKHKLNTFNKTYVSSDVWIFDSDWWFRRYHRESGMKTIEFIKDILDNAIKYGQKYQEYSMSIHESVTGIRPGIEKLLKVYGDEPTVKSELELIITRINPENFLFTLTRTGSQPVSIPIIKTISNGPIYGTPES